MATNSAAYGIDDSGAVVGAMGSITHAFLYDGVSNTYDMQTGTLPNGTPDLHATFRGLFSYAAGINNAGDVVGAAADSAGDYHAFLYDAVGHKMTALDGTSGSNDSDALGINNHNQVVGYYFAGDTYHAFLYDNINHFRDLNSLVSYPGWTLISAVGINDNGQITGLMQEDCNPTIQDCFVLTPAPSHPRLLCSGARGLGPLRRVPAAKAECRVELLSNRQMLRPRRFRRDQRLRPYESQSSPKSNATAECVSAPTLIRSTPLSAIARTVDRVDAARSLQLDRRRHGVATRHGLAELGRIHVV